MGKGGQEPFFVVSMENTDEAEQAGLGLAGLNNFCGSAA